MAENPVDLGVDVEAIVASAFNLTPAAMAERLAAPAQLAAQRPAQRMDADGEVSIVQCWQWNVCVTSACVDLSAALCL